MKTRKVLIVLTSSAGLYSQHLRIAEDMLARALINQDAADTLEIGTIKTYRTSRVTTLKKQLLETLKLGKNLGFIVCIELSGVVNKIKADLENEAIRLQIDLVFDSETEVVIQNTTSNLQNEANYNLAKKRASELKKAKNSVRTILSVLSKEGFLNKRGNPITERTLYKILQEVG